MDAYKHISNRLQGQPFQVFEGLGAGKHFVAGLGIVRSKAYQSIEFSFRCWRWPLLSLARVLCHALPARYAACCMLSLVLATSSANEVEGIWTWTSGTATVKTHLFLHANHRVLLWLTGLYLDSLLLSIKLHFPYLLHFNVLVSASFVANLISPRASKCAFTTHIFKPLWSKCAATHPAVKRLQRTLKHLFESRDALLWMVLDSSCLGSVLCCKPAPVLSKSQTSQVFELHSSPNSAIHHRYP